MTFATRPSRRAQTTCRATPRSSEAAVERPRPRRSPAPRIAARRRTKESGRVVTVDGLLLEAARLLARAGESLNQQGLEVGARRIDRSGMARRPGADDDHVTNQ